MSLSHGHRPKFDATCVGRSSAERERSRTRGVAYAVGVVVVRGNEEGGESFSCAGTHVDLISSSVTPSMRRCADNVTKMVSCVARAIANPAVGEVLIDTAVG
jgi:hypothetical protein